MIAAAPAVRPIMAYGDETETIASREGPSEVIRKVKPPEAQSIV